jgi:hypothetical protein
MTDKITQVSDSVRARDGIEAQRGLNDIFPGDPYPAVAVLKTIRQQAVQAVGAGISRRDWHATETAYNELRDQTDDLIGRLERRSTAAESRAVLELRQTKAVLAAVRENVQRLEVQLAECRKSNEH